MRLRIAVLPGDGIGPEVTREACRVLGAVAEIHGHQFDLEEWLIGASAIEATGSPLPDTTLEACMKADAVLLGAVGAPGFDASAPQARPEAGLLALRRASGAFANLRPAVWRDSLAEGSPLKASIGRGTDILFVRELLGGLYFGEPRGRTDDGEVPAAFNTMRYDVREVERVARVAFVEARARRRKVTSVDKANVLETSQLWRETVDLVARDYPDVELEHAYVDSFAMALVLEPRRFDVVLTENLFGDILTDEAAAITGSIGVLASASIGGRVAIYEPIHGSAPGIAGSDIANPIGAIASAAMLLRYSARLEAEAADIESAVEAVLATGHRTADIAPGRETRLVSTTTMGSLVTDAVSELSEMRHPYHAV